MIRDLKQTGTETGAPTSRRTFMELAAVGSALLVSGAAMGATPAYAAEANNNAVPENEVIIRRAYGLAEVKPSPDLEGWINAFTTDGTFTDMSSGTTYRGRDLSAPVDFMAKAFPDIHRELFRVYSVGDMVLVELSINGTNTGPMGSTPPNGNKMAAPCFDVFKLRDGKIVSFNCYPLMHSPVSWTEA